MVGGDSVVGTGARYGVDGVRIESRWGGARFSATVHTDPGGHPTSTGSFSGLRWPGCDVEHLPPSSAEGKKKEYRYTSIPLLQLHRLF